MGVLIDASTLIAYERGHLDLEHKLAGREDEEFFLSVITASELLHGVHRATEAHRARRSAIVEAILDHGLTLVTENLREFRRVPGLTIESWKD